ncbi:MAG: hypothetical protein HXK70_03865 [Clostridiales bacterium]|nr:hypothetical protein [Clostridiales bacterium]
MRKNEKIEQIEKLFKGGPVDIFKLLHFLIENGEHYRKLEFRTNSSEILRIYKKNRTYENMFLDIVDSKGNAKISEYEIKFYNQILDIQEFKKMGLISKKFSINHIVE